MTFPVHTQKSLDALTWNEVQKLCKRLGLNGRGTRRELQNRIVAAMPQPVVEAEQIATPLTCATCPFAILLDDNRYECGARVTNAVTRGHWEANSDCYQKIANLETEMTELIAVAEIPATSSAPSETQPEAPITPAKRAIPFFFNLPLPEYVAFSKKQSVLCCLESTTRDRAKEYKEQLQLAHQGYKVYGGNQPPVVEFWQIHAYLQLVNRLAAYTEVINNAGSLDATECLDFIIASECPFIFHELEHGKQYFNYAPLAKYVWATNGCQADIGTDVMMHDSIHAIAERIRSVLAESKNFARYPQPSWYVEMIAEIREHQKSLPDAPIAQPEEILAAATTTTDDAPPNRGDNGRGRVTSSLPKPTVTIASIPHATKPKADNNFMTAFTKESEGDRKFNDLAYLSQLELEAQLAIERTEIGSEQEAIAYAHLRQIERDIEFNNRPEPKPQPSPAIQQLETQMKELKADTLKLFKITAFHPSILPVDADELEQPATKCEPEPEGTIHWTTPLRGVIVGKKGATRHFYIRNDEIFIMLSADFTASEKRYPNNIRIQQIRNAVELGRTFNPRIFKISPNFERDTQVCNGGRIRQECDGRWWAWADGGVTGQPFPCENLAIQYLDRIAASKHSQKQTLCIK